ncbi:MAG: M1 family metallopeptidase [Candidatus Thorarchaeota archaeon]
MSNIKYKYQIIVVLSLFSLSFNCLGFIERFPQVPDKIYEDCKKITYNPQNIPIKNSNGGEFSFYSLSIIFDESASSVTGNLSVNYYNNDLVSFTQIPFHLFLSGMQYSTRKGSIEILGVHTLNEPKTPLIYSVDQPSQLLWVTLESELAPNQRAFFEIEFTAIIPNGGIDRANSHGSDIDNSRIYKFTSFYPMPCVYDIYDQWNTDPYLDVGDPFYHDMANYNLSIEAPADMIIAATGELIEKVNKGATIIYQFRPTLPVREVTFTASKYFEIQSTIIDGVNISTYYLPKSSFVWENDALDYAINAYNLFDTIFGDYPYSTLNIVEEFTVGYLGMEYPLQVYASELIDSYIDFYPIQVVKDILEKVIVHEIAHQWWYNLVGVDEVDWGFLDEGLTCWSTDYYATIYHSSWTYFQWTRYYDSVRTYYVTHFLPSKINQSAYDMIEDNLDWVYISYTKAPLIFEKISRSIGQSNFLLGLSNFYHQFKFEIALLNDLKYVLENTVNQSLDWLFFPWFDNDYIPHYKISKCTFNDDAGNLTVVIEDLTEDENTYAYSQQVLFIVFDTGKSILYSNKIWINSTTSLVIPLSVKPEKVRLDYGQDVITQLGDASITYVEALVGEGVVVPGYNINLILIIIIVPIVYLIYTFSNKTKSKFKN